MVEHYASRVDISCGGSGAFVGDWMRKPACTDADCGRTPASGRGEGGSGDPYCGEEVGVGLGNMGSRVGPDCGRGPSGGYAQIETRGAGCAVVLSALWCPGG